jgi:hypothetical protein
MDILARAAEDRRSPGAPPHAKRTRAMTRSARIPRDGSTWRAGFDDRRARVFTANIVEVHMDLRRLGASFRASSSVVQRPPHRVNAA